MIASVALFISQTVISLTGYNYLDTNVLALVLGVFAQHFGFIEEAPLNKSNSYGLAMLSLTVVILGSLANATPDVLLQLLPMLIITLLLGAVGIIIFSLIASKFLNVSFWMGIGIGVSALFGFPVHLSFQMKLLILLVKATLRLKLFVKKFNPKCWLLVSSPFQSHLLY